MILGTVTKQAGETLDYDVDYTDWPVIPGDHLQSMTATVAPTGTAGDLAIGSIFNNDPKMKVWLSAGRAGVTYLVSVTTTTTGGRIKQDEFKVKVVTK